MKDLTPDLNLDEEAAAIAAFLAKKWTPIPDLLGLVVAIRDEAMHAGRAFVERFDAGSLAHDLGKAREALLEKSGAHQEARYYDAYCNFLSRVWHLDDALCDIGRSLDGKWDFERRTKQLSTRLCARFPGLPAMLPLGYEYTSDKNEHDLCEAYSSKADCKLFEGSKAESVLSGTFPWRVALSTVLATDRNGLAPWHQLVGAVFGQFLCIAQYLNTHRLMEALKKALPYADPELQFALPEKFDNPLLQALLVWGGPVLSKEAFEGAVMMRESAKMSRAKQAAYVKDRPELMQAYMQGLDIFNNRLNHRDPATRDRMVQELNGLLASAATAV